MRAEVRETIEFLLPFSAELYFYTVDGVRNTAHVPPGSVDKPDNWTIYLLETLTELTSREGVSAEVIRLAGSLLRNNKHLIELGRTFSAIHCYRLCQQEKYAAFVEAQNGLNDQLTLENFQLLHEGIQNIAPDEDSQSALAALIIFSDLGKSPETRKLAAQQGINATLDTDDLMLAILQLPDENIGKIIPYYLSLSSEAKQLLKEAYPFMTICFGHIFFAEGNSKAFLDIQTILRKMTVAGIPLLRRKQLLDLVFAAQFFDGAGAQGQKYMYGSRTCTNDFYRGYMLKYSMLQKLHTEPAEYVFAEYLMQRAQWMGLDKDQFASPEAFDVVLRLGCTLRLFDSETDKASAQALRVAFESLSAADQNLLIEELSFRPNRGLNQFAHAPHYVATGAQNICRNEPGTLLRAEDMQNIFNYTVVLARLVQKLRTRYAAVIQDSVLPVNFGGVAFLANNPDNVANPHAVNLADLLQKEPILPKPTVLKISVAAANLIKQRLAVRARSTGNAHAEQAEGVKLNQIC